MLFDHQIDEHTKEKKMRAYLKKQKIYDTWAAILGFLGWVWELAQCFSYYDEISEVDRFVTVIHRLDGGSYSVLKYEIRLIDRNESTVLTILRVGVTISTIALMFCVCCSYIMEYKRIVLDGGFYKKLVPGPKWQPFERGVRKRLRRWLLLELVYLSIHSLPSVNANFEIGNQSYFLEYSLDLIIFVIMQGRFYLFIRMAKHYSRWLDLDAVYVCKSQGAPGGYSFGCRALLKDNPIIFVMSQIIITTIIGSLAMMVLERPYQFTSNQNWSNYVNALWCGFNLMTSVGYGDLYPVTHSGRAAGFFILLAGQLLTALIVTFISAVVSFTKSEENAYYKIKECLQKEKFLEANKQAIKYALLYFLESKVRQREIKHTKYYTQLQLTLARCRDLRRANQLEEINRPFNFLIESKKLQLTEKKFEVIKAIRRVETFITRLSDLEKKMDSIEEMTSTLYRSNLIIYKVLEAVKEECSVETPFDGLIAYPQALRFIDKLKKLKRPTILVPTDSNVGVQDLYETRSLVNSDKILRRRLVRRITNAQTLVDKELVHLTSDKNLPTLTFHDKRELNKIQNAKENLKKYVEQKKQRMEVLHSKKKIYLSGPQLMERLRKKAHLVKLSIRMRSRAMQNLARLANEEYYNNASSIKEDSSELDTPSLIKSDLASEQTTVTAPSNAVIQEKKFSINQENVLDLLKEEDEDSALDSDLDGETENGGSSFPDTQGTGSNSQNSQLSQNVIGSGTFSPEMKPMPSIFKKASIRMAAANNTKEEVKENNDRGSKSQKSILSFTPSQDIIIYGDKRLSYNSEGLGKSTDEIMELAKALNIVDKQQQGSQEDVDAPVEDLKKMGGRIGSNSRLSGIGSEKLLMTESDVKSGSKDELKQTRRGPANFFDYLKMKERKISDFVPSEKADSNSRGDTINTLITKETQENEMLTENSPHIRKYFASLEDNVDVKRRDTEELMSRTGGQGGAPIRMGNGDSAINFKDDLNGENEERSIRRFGKYPDINELDQSKNASALGLALSKRGMSLKLSTQKQSVDGPNITPEIEWSPAMRRRTVDPYKKVDEVVNTDFDNSRINLLGNRQTSEISLDGDSQSLQQLDVSMNKHRERGKSLWSYLKNV